VLKKRFFKTKQEVEVAFELTHEAAGQVALLCEANGWDPIEMKQDKRGRFRAKLRLPKERKFQFRYLVDGTTWTNDEEADGYCRNQFGGENGILDTSPSA